MEEIRSKIARYIAGEIKLDQMIDHSRLSVPVQKRFKFEDTWITMNRKIGEAVTGIGIGIGTGMDSSSQHEHGKRSQQPQTARLKRRKAVAIVDPQTRLMTNGRTWPCRDDWVIGSDNKIRYAARLQPLRRLDSAEWNADIASETAAVLPEVVAVDVTPETHTPSI